MSLVDQNGSIKSDNVKATYDGTKWSTSDVVNYSPTYQYYAYYPYSASGLAHLGASSAKGAITASETSYASGMQAVASRTPANGTSSANASFASNAQNASSSAIGAQASTRAVSANTSATDFFASGISAFTPATDQSTATNFNASDLQIGKATINRTLADDIDFDLTHAMGLAEVTIPTTTKSVPTQIIYDGNKDSITSQNGTAITISISKNFSGTTPYNTGKNNLYAAFVKPSTGATFTATTSGGALGWSHTFNIAANSTSNYALAEDMVSARPAYTVIWNYDYLGSVKELTVPSFGTYKLEVYGAQGGMTSYYFGRGGKGGYAYGNVTLTRGQQLYICVGQDFGDTGSATHADITAYNGGGAGNPPGGGATHIAISTNRGVLSNYINYKSEVLIVAGGGGGGERFVGGTGGGTNGGDGNTTRLDDGEIHYVSITCKGGTQATGGSGGVTTNNLTGGSGSFGQGGSGAGADYGAGGGGGWYGGGGIPWAGSGGGGSGHINTDYITDGAMQNGVREGSGYTTITLVP